ncbi:peptide-methionine (S)-S-oxide reductase MsrA [Sporosarcina sp.]|uniref:peptide-methionine (S)-S-oxide reductase MsrA n=1 Tax=Sporosarcina sp. TaxID=49982 RepID=UPI0026097BA7|nr:peptide-methionine (S)-S-oxide reductase MsrA [Sporosarcina sp.]
MLTAQEIENELIENHRLETATFGMGCFWGPESRFGSLRGVFRTRTGYAGGTTASPTYRTLGDHTETVEIDFDPEILSFEDVLKHFWRNHYPNRDEYRGRQYLSSLRYHGIQQKEVIDRVKNFMETELGETIETEITELQQFYLAEERHQKYYLKRYPGVLEQLSELYPDQAYIRDSIFAARLNGIVKGFGTKQQIVAEIQQWRIPDKERHKLIQKFLHLKW